MDVEVGGRLVEVEDARPVQEAARQQQLAAHAERVGPDRQVGRLVEFDQAQALFHARGSDAVQSGEELQITTAAELLEVGFAVRYVAEKRLDQMALPHHLE